MVELGTHLRKEFILSALRVSQYEPGKDGAMLVGESSELATGSTKLEIIQYTTHTVSPHSSSPLKIKERKCKQLCAQAQNSNDDMLL